MIYLAWAAMYEGDTDAAYFDVLIPRVMEELVRTEGRTNVDIPTNPEVRLRRDSVEAVAELACKARDAFYLLFIHGDSGGRSVSASLDNRTQAVCAAMQARCDWPPARCVTIAPDHETEAWLLADPDAVRGFLGYTGRAADIGLPVTAKEAENLTDPKATLAHAVQTMRGKRRPYDPKQIFPAIAQRHTIANLRRAPSFAIFENRLRAALVDLGCLQPT